MKSLGVKPNIFICILTGALSCSLFAGPLFQLHGQVQSRNDILELRSAWLAGPGQTLPYSKRSPSCSLAAWSSQRAQASLALADNPLELLHDPPLQFSDPSHGFIKAGILKRQFFLFGEIPSLPFPFELAAPYRAHCRSSVP